MRLAVGLAFLATVGTGVALWWALWQHVPPTPGPSASAQSAPPEDPRVAYRGPLENIHPRVRYVGDAACADCRFDVVQPYRASAMGRSSTPVADVAASQR